MPLSTTVAAESIVFTMYGNYIEKFINVFHDVLHAIHGNYHHNTL